MQQTLMVMGEGQLAAAVWRLGCRRQQQLVVQVHWVAPSRFPAAGQFLWSLKSWLTSSAQEIGSPVRLASLSPLIWLGPLEWRCDAS